MSFPTGISDQSAVLSTIRGALLVGRVGCRAQPRWRPVRAPSAARLGTSLLGGCRIARISMTEIIPPMLALLAIMIGVLMLVTCLPESFMWLPRRFGFAR
jgi:hypothetical protein